MTQITLQRINDGDTGAMSAKKIYNNDNNLLTAIRAIEDILDAYGSLITIETEDRHIDVVEGPGQSTTSVMTQKAVTNFVYENVEDVCQIGQTINGGVQMPDTGEYADVWVSRASSNAQGNSLTTLWNDVQELKNLHQTIADMQATIESLTERVSELEHQNYEG
jgi:hypothetical protein